ncbi:MAG TPA: cupin domain-containing protein [Sphingomicrobium sp.]|nr:cupin domain-containing protein [Sphingomicrobium sp.]
MSEREIVCADFDRAIDDLKREGFRLDVIYPADEPYSAVLSRGGERVRVTSRPDASLIPSRLPPFVPEFVLTRAEGAPVQGRAGMLYRDLIPSRLGGRYIASHIAIPDGGPVADWVHYHRIALQLIYVARGWVRVVYEDQGDPFVMNPGDFVLQPPEIRHRVLESSPGLEVVEVTAPALHETFADHEMQLPNGLDVARTFGRQRFLRHMAERTPWTPFGGGEAQESALEEATGGLAQLRTVRPDGSQPITFEPHDDELVFGYLLEGSAGLGCGPEFALEAGAAFVIPPSESWSLAAPSADFRLLHLTVAGLP